MKVNYRQGIVTSHTDANGVPAFLSRDIVPNYISLYINAKSTIITFAHEQSNYLYEEANTVEQAWGPFVSPLRPCYWLYWDIDVDTGMRTFGQTSLAPIVSPTRPLRMDVDQHWFNTSNGTMYISDGYSWLEKIRVFAGTFTGNTLTPFNFESQVGFTDSVFAGFILFDDNDLPLVRSNNRKFLTTESQFYTTKSNIGTVSFDTVIFHAGAIENIPAYSVVSYYDDNNISIASSNDIETKAAVGLIRNEVYRTEVTSVVTNGYITNIDWNFVEPPATPLYLGIHGSIQTQPPQTGFIQKIGTIVSRDTILIDIDPQIIFNDGSPHDSYSPVSIDLISGKLYTSKIVATTPPDTGSTGGTGPGVIPTPEPNVTKVIGLSCTQLKEKMRWTINHNLGSTNIFVQVYDDVGDYVIPNSVTIVDPNTIDLFFAAPIAGTAQLLLVTDPQLIVIPDLNVPTYEYNQSKLEAVWVVDHNIGHTPITRVYDDNGVQVVPYSIVHPTVNRTIITFTLPRTGIVRFI